MGEKYSKETAGQINDIFANTYITPYLAKGYEYFQSMSLSELGYKTNITNRAGSRIVSRTGKNVIIRLNDGTVIVPSTAYLYPQEM